MKQFITMASTILIAGLSVVANADTTNLLPCDDMYTDVEHPSTPPTPDQLWVAESTAGGHFERIMMQFDLSELYDATIEDATLHLYRFFSCPITGTTATNFYAITQEWDEETWDPHTHIQYDPYVWTSFTFSGPGGNYGMWFEVDIKDLVQAWLDNTIENHGFVIRAQTGNNWSKFYSKEYSNPNLHPYLEVNYTPGAVGDENFQIPPFLSPNYPNPFSGSTTFKFTLPYPAHVELSVYNIRGERLATVVDEEMGSGSYEIPWSPSNGNSSLTNGIYFYRLEAGDNTVVKKMVIMQ